ncbi:hypothetical protein SMD44_00965 [Streptomyces alboflavus]|uniref:Uncharacterized protein n=1 Tax=Streptomyces alboflavus TaxID=67267 RepID=A0A1Z1W587_9ACTN|nr:hypothetical protein [Streptomyces alboflavus]ARX81567.1 hypothetical protein SMD44_00965 [Streptomyces alboflavus]
MRYAWCFSHGLLHRFADGPEPWCTATWTWIDGATEDEAQAAKKQRFGNARFLDELPGEQQLELLDISDES